MTEKNAVAEKNAVTEKSAAGPVQILDAPVSGMAAGAEAGTLQIFVGGEEADLPPCPPAAGGHG